MADTLAGRTPGRLDLAAVRGDDLQFVADFEDQDGVAIDVTGWTVAAQVRATYGGALLVDLTVESNTDDAELATNQLRVSATAAQMASVGEGAWPWDLQRTAGGPSSRTLLAGTVQVRPDVTEA